MYLNIDKRSCITLSNVDNAAIMISVETLMLACTQILGLKQGISMQIKWLKNIKIFRCIIPMTTIFWKVQNTITLHPYKEVFFELFKLYKVAPNEFCLFEAEFFHFETGEDRPLVHH